MKLTATTIEVLKNFSTINQGIQFIPGNIQRTTSTQQNVLAEFKTSEEFPIECAIFDLSKFLAILTLFEEPELDFKQQWVEITSAKNSNVSRYFYSHPRLIVTPNRKDIKIEKQIDEFDISNDTLSKLNKSAMIIGAPDLVIESDGKERTLTVCNSKIKGSNNFVVKEKVKGEKYSITLKNDNLKIIPSSYTVDVCENSGTKFVIINSGNLTYAITGEI